MNNKDKEQIEQLKEVKEWILWFRSLSQDEKDEIIIKRWTDKAGAPH